MVVDQTTSTALAPGPAPLPTRAKYRIRFRKADNLRLVSHHDLMHVFERMLRRAELPLCTTQGFHPQPRMVFAQSLALGVAGNNEVVELELKEVFPPQEVHARLVRQTPPGMDILSTRSIDFKAGAQVRRAFYRLDVGVPPSGGILEPPVGGTPTFADRCAALLSATEIWVERTRPRPRRFNLRPYVNKLAFSQGVLEMAVWVTPNGTVRPEEVAHLLGLDSALEFTFFERTHLELHDEVAKDDPEVIPACLLEIPPPTDRLRFSAPKQTGAKPQSATEQTEPAQDETFNAQKGLA